MQRSPSTARALTRNPIQRGSSGVSQMNLLVSARNRGDRATDVETPAQASMSLYSSNSNCLLLESNVVASSFLSPPCWPSCCSSCRMRVLCHEKTGEMTYKGGRSVTCVEWTQEKEGSSKDKPSVLECSAIRPRRK